MKTIGIVGGLSPESTILYYKYIVEEYRRRSGNEYYPKIVIYSVCFGKFIDLISSNKLDEAIELLLEAIEALYRAGADFALISANTPHMLFDKLKSKSPIPLLSIIDALADELKKDGVKKVGLLGTRFTLTHGFYAEGLKKHGIESLIPDSHDIGVVNNIIFNELVRGIVREESRRVLEDLVCRLVARGAEGIALACTELPLILHGTICGVKLYDTARIHATKALEYAMSD